MLINFLTTNHKDFDEVVYQNKRFVLIEKISPKFLEKCRVKYYRKLSKNLTDILSSVVEKKNDV